ncbi:hypothetical protein K9M18_05490, partial [Candidatus Woesearchaeota archaeon]|nr:hypothetical protein [Candidatus Woesearchaeota archaeon]
MVNINVVKDLDTKKDVLLLGIFSENVDFYKSINPELHSKLEEAIKRKSFSLKKDAYHSFSLNNSVYEKIVVSYLGSKKEFDLERIRRAIYNGIKVAKQNKLKGLTCNVSELCKGLTSDYYLGVAIGETIELSDYDFDNHLSKEKKKAKIGFASILWTGSKDFLKGLKDGKIIGEST